MNRSTFIRRLDWVLSVILRIVAVLSVVAGVDKLREDLVLAGIAMLVLDYVLTQVSEAINAHGDNRR